MASHSTLEENLRAVRARIDEACAAAGRAPREVELLAVTKSVEPEVAADLLALGQRELGENRLAELERKHAYFAERSLAVTWHFIGHVQRNKARRIALLADTIHSIDSVPLLRALERHCADAGRELRGYLQVDVAREPRKHGLDPERLSEALQVAREARHVRIVGLMTMAPLQGGRPAARATFDRLAALARDAQPEDFGGRPPRLSMGMSADLGEAVAAGAHVLRIGRALFQPSEDSAGDDGPEDASA